MDQLHATVINIFAKHPPPDSQETKTQEIVILKTPPAKTLPTLKSIILTI